MRRLVLGCGVLVLGCARGPEGAEHGGGSSTGADSSGGPPLGDTTTDAGSDGGSTGASATAGTGVDGDSSDSGSDSGGPVDAGLRYDEVAQKSAHNSYQRLEAPIDLLVYHRVRSLELDIHVGKTLQPTQAGSWYVYHQDVLDDETWCTHLDDCLDAITAFTHAVPEHEVTTLWIDLKDDWDETHDPAALDAALEAAFGSALVDGAELREGCNGATTVQAAVGPDGCGWPTLASLRGRVLVVLTGGAAVLRAYHDDDPEHRRALVAPELDGLGDAEQWPQTVVFNYPVERLDAAAGAADAGFITRVWGIADADQWQAARNAGVHHLGTDNVNAEVDPWARTHDDDGWPFACRASCEPTVVAEGAVLGMTVDSGDVWGSDDSGFFVHDDRSGAPAGIWTAFASSANSHVEPFAKACIMARVSLASDSPYFAVCRPADDEPLRVQWRADFGDDSTAVEDDIVAPDTVDPPAAAFLRLTIDDEGLCATGEGSLDGDAWVEIASHCFAAPLALQGLAASSHDAGELRLLFGDVRLDGGRPRGSADFEHAAPLGGGDAIVFDGVMP